METDFEKKLLCIEKYNQLISMWDIQDGLLQSYRSIFITSESILLAISTTILTSNVPYLSIILSGLGYFVLHMWKLICNARSLDVSFLQWLLLRIDRSDIDVEKPVDAFKKWQDTKKFKNDDVLKDDDFKDMVSNSATRTKIATFVFYKASIVKIATKAFCTS
ncbi:MAG: hypothetical protein K8R12_03925 [Desulfobacterales bacterium]|nr:hypothetical protein [Desulfobacterales bacterium]